MPENQELNFEGVERQPLRTFTEKAYLEYSMYVILDRALPANGGAESVETALKAARKWGYRVKGIPEGRAEIIVCENNFPGRSITPILGYTRNAYSGPGRTTYHVGQDEFRISSDLDDIDQEVRAGLAFDAVERARAQNYDVVLIDTAGRLQNKSELMNELEKVVRSGVTCGHPSSAARTGARSATSK